MGQITRTTFGLSSITTFDNTAILALPTTTPTLIPAITGKVILPHLIMYQLNPWIADYTNIDGASKVAININGQFTSLNPVFAGSVLFAGGEAQIIWTEVGRDMDYNAFDWADMVSMPLVLNVTNAAAGNFTGGNAGNSLTVQTFYEVIE